MKFKHSILIGLSIILSVGIYSGTKFLADYLKTKRGHEMQIRMMEIQPKEVTIGDQKVLYLPRISYRDLTIDVNFEFYSIIDGELRKLHIQP